MTGPDSTVGRLLADTDSALRRGWETSVEQFVRRLGDSLKRPELFDDVRGLLLQLSALVDRPAFAVAEGDEALGGILEQVRQLQSRAGLRATDMAFLLFSVRDILRVALPMTSEEPPEEPNAPASPIPLDQISSLLNRLALVQFETDIRARPGLAVEQDVLAAEYALLYERTRQLAITDQLTGLHNFGYFLERLREERARAERYQRLLSLILFDIDHFKHYNDGQGHLAGNEVLKRIATILRAEAREVDLVARYGGEELVIVLPEATRRDATTLAERIRTRIWETHFEHMETQPLGRLSVSAGVATFPVDARDDTELIRRSDQSLYEAKAQGRNRVVSYLPPLKKRLTFRPQGMVDSVALVGNFNNWDKDYDLMYPVADGSYEFVISLNPGVYQYKFVLNGSAWIPDPACEERCPDTLGGENSVLRVDSPPDVGGA